MSGKVATAQSVSNADINSIVHGRHDDAYAVLGAHKIEGGFGFRAFLPGAVKVSLVHRSNGRMIAEADCIDAAGFYAVDLKRKTKIPPAHAWKVWFEGQTAPMRINEAYVHNLLLDDDVINRWGNGSLFDAGNQLGANPYTVDGVPGMRFVVWAPAARRIAVVGDFNIWDGRRNMMRCRHQAGLWEAFVPDIGAGQSYKFEIHDAAGNKLPLKSDPFGKASEYRPGTASITVKPSEFQWRDEGWMQMRGATTAVDAPISVYEIQAGSWMKPWDGRDYFDFAELADKLVPYVQNLGFTHIQLMPTTEYPFDGSWGYQPIGLFAPTSRFGTADHFRYFVNACHEAGIGVLFDWVPAHFPLDDHGLARFDGTSLFEHEDPRQGYHPDWNTGIFNFGRPEVRAYLLSNALYWLKEFHIDGLRVDAVSSMLYLNYSREDGEWIPNKDGGNSNLEAISFLQQLNHECYVQCPGIVMIAEESTAWNGVSHPTDQGGLGFGYKWNLGWMHDTLEYMQKEPVHRQHHHDEMTFPMVYAYNENFFLPLSHDEVVHGKGSLLDRMPGDAWQKFANLRAYYGFMWAHPGKKLLFMGCEFAQGAEWNFNKALDWELLDNDWHRGMKDLVADLNKAYISLPALHEKDCDGSGFRWVQSHAGDVSVFAWLRFDATGGGPVLIVSNMTPVVRQYYQLGVPIAGDWELVINSDDLRYGGSGCAVSHTVTAHDGAWDDLPSHLHIDLPPLSTIMYRKVR